ncbi:ABC transporter ATP-binding protein [Saccharobesus litoralis]|uniref:ABC transporter ATP-binding protein n=1 Tax=Saccharobesus litoralis TaxID=2172099 RepID=A0A2S0VTK2_9ALTE|nr:ABC transporter ATP-binding protein [Saccharobesus litoralis]AWB67544.1 ABC transporter ATP-binding protein [Saccharobesus litoralis]
MLSNQPILQVNALTKTVKTNGEELKLLRPTSFTIQPKQTVAIVGASGSGKSTLLGLLAGLDTASTGEIKLAGNDLHHMDEEQRARVRAEHVGFVYQSFMLISSLTALENIMLPLELAGDATPTESAKKWLEQVGLAHRAEHFPNQLSGGEQQRVAIARAFACRPKILFADEPTGNLDAENGKNIQNLLFELNQQQDTTLVLVTHDLHLAHKCQRIFHMQAGVIAEELEGDNIKSGGKTG